MTPLVFLAAGFAPGVFWLWRIYLRNRHRPDPKNLVVRTFILGAVAAIPIGIFESIIAPEGGLELAKGNTAKVAYYAFVVAGVTEEVGKFLVVRWSLFASPYLKEAMSGLVFGSAAALGFASLENVGYMAEFGPVVIATRAIFSTLGHVVFSACWAYPLGWHKQELLEGRPAIRWPLALGLAGAAALHGLFDFYLMKEAPEVWKTLVVFAVGLVLFLYLLRRASALSPFRELNVAASRTCPRCNGVNRSGARFCVACGSGLDGVRIKCGHCGAMARPEADFCASCGFRFALT